MLSKLLVSNVQRFSLQDGPGIRTTVFLQGCSLRCPWCCNPEAVFKIPAGANADDLTPYESCGDKLLELVLRDQPFYGMKGGVTFSGGEPLLQIEALAPILDKLSSNGIGICFETSLFASPKAVEAAAVAAQLLYVDVKVLDRALCCNVLKGDLELYLSNLKLLRPVASKVIMRIPVITGFTDSRKNMEAVAELAGNFHPLRVELLEGHNLAAPKYAKLKLGYEPIEPIRSELLDEYRKLLVDADVEVTILRR